MEIRKTIYYIDCEWMTDGGIYGDMGYSICDAAETRTESLEECREMAEYGIKCDKDNGSYGEDLFDEFPIYSIVKAVAYDECEDADDFSLSLAVLEEQETIAVYPACDESLGYTEKLRKYYGDEVELHYV